FDAVATQVWREANITASALPLVVGFFDNDAFAQLRAGIRQGGLVARGISETLELAVGLSAIGNKLAQEVTERLAEADGERIAEYGELLEMISEFGAELNDEDHVRRNIASSLQQMELLALQIRALEAEGLRLQNERAAFNMVLAGK